MEPRTDFALSVREFTNKLVPIFEFILKKCLSLGERISALFLNYVFAALLANFRLHRHLMHFPSPRKRKLLKKKIAKAKYVQGAASAPFSPKIP